MADLPWLPAHVGWEWGYYREYEWIRPNPGVLQMALPLDVRRLGYRAAFGAAIDLPDQEGQIAAEVQATRDFRNDHLRQFPDIDSETRSYHVGAEYRAALAAGSGGRRAPAQRSRPPGRDRSLQGDPDLVRRGAYWAALGAQIDAAFAHEHFHHAPADPSREIGPATRSSTISRLF